MEEYDMIVGNHIAAFEKYRTGQLAEKPDLKKFLKRVGMTIEQLESVRTWRNGKNG